MSFLDMFRRTDINEGFARFQATPGAVLLDVSGSGAAIQNVTLNARNVRHAVQFYCVDGGRLREVTVHGGPTPPS